MKFTAEAECTPKELRTLLGLPDVEPMQEAVMDELERRLMKGLDHLSPTQVIKDWFTLTGVVQKRVTNLVTSPQIPGFLARGDSSDESDESGSSSGS